MLTEVEQLFTELRLAGTTLSRMRPLPTLGQLVPHGADRAPHQPPSPVATPACPRRRRRGGRASMSASSGAALCARCMGLSLGAFVST